MPSDGFRPTTTETLYTDLVLRDEQTSPGTVDKLKTAMFHEVQLTTGFWLLGLVGINIGSIGGLGAAGMAALGCAIIAAVLLGKKLVTRLGRSTGAGQAEPVARQVAARLVSAFPGIDVDTRDEDKTHIWEVDYIDGRRTFHFHPEEGGDFRVGLHHEHFGSVEINGTPADIGARTAHWLAQTDRAGADGTPAQLGGVGPVRSVPPRVNTHSSTEHEETLKQKHRLFMGAGLGFLAILMAVVPFVTPFGVLAGGPAFAYVGLVVLTMLLAFFSMRMLGRGADDAVETREVEASVSGSVVCVDRAEFDLEAGGFAVNLYRGLFGELVVDLARGAERLRFGIDGVSAADESSLDAYAVSVSPLWFKQHVWPQIAYYADAHGRPMARQVLATLEEEFGPAKELKTLPRDEALVEEVDEEKAVQFQSSGSSGR